MAWWTQCCFLHFLENDHCKVHAVEISIERSEQNKIEWSVLVAGSLMAFFGFSVYYVLPFSLLTLNLPLLFNVFLVILLGMLLGLVCLSLNLTSVLEKVFACIFFAWWESSSVVSLVYKNLIVHQRRNRKTTAMYAIALSIVMIGIISYYTNIYHFMYLVQQEHGAHLVVSVRGRDPSKSTFTQCFYHIILNI